MIQLSSVIGFRIFMGFAQFFNSKDIMIHKSHFPLTVIFLFFFYLQPFPLSAEIVDRCVAVVNDDVITLSEVNEAGLPIFRRVAEQTPPDQLQEVLKQARASVTEKLIEKKLLLQEAKKYNITVTEEEVDMALQRILASNNASMEQFHKQLADMGLNEKQYKEDLKDQILSSKVVNMAVRSKVIVPEEEIIDYYDMHYTEQVGDGGYYILQLGITWNKNDDTTDPDAAKKEAKEKALRIRSLAVSGKDFKELAREYSDLPSAADGGDIGVFREKEMASVMRNAVVGLQPGQVSEIVETSSGYQIFKLLSSQEGQIVTKVPYESVKEEIQETLYQQKMQDLYKNWIKEIREQAYIKTL